MLSSGIPLGLLLALVSYGLGWQRGFYMDDYSNRAAGYDVVAHQPLPIWSPAAIPGFPVRALAWSLNRQLAVWLADHEWAVRGACSLLAALNALLLGGLLARLSGSRVAGVAAGWIYLSPFVAQEAVLWAGAVSYTLTVTLALLGIAAILRGAMSNRCATCVAWSAAGVGAFVLCMLCFETPLTLTALLPFAAAALALRHGQPVGRALRRSILAVASLAVLAGVYAALFYGRAPMLETRGGLVRSAGEWFGRLSAFMQGLEWLTIGSYGMRLTGEALALGAEALLGSIAGMLVFAASVIVGAATVLGWVPRRGGAARRPLAGGALLIVAGIAVFFSSYWLPATLVRGQIVEFRMLYMPLAGACVSLAGVLTIATALLPWAWFERMLFATAAAAGASSAVCMLGYCTTFAARHSLDQRQVAALLEAVPVERLPAGACFVPLEVDERLFGRDDALSRLLFGVFATTWSANAQLREVYHTPDVQASALNPWLGVRLSEKSASAPAAGPAQLQFNQVDVHTDRAIPFAYRNGRVWLIDRMTIRAAHRAPQELTFSAVQAAIAHGGRGGACATVEIAPDGTQRWTIEFPDAAGAVRLDSAGTMPQDTAAERG